MSASLLNIGTSALSAAQGSLATTSHNIANANTDGYSRQEAVLSTAGAQYTGSGFFGRGVDLTTVRRHYDAFLTGAVQVATAASAADAARATGLEALDAVFASGELGIGAAIDAFFAAAGDLANRPSDFSARQVFLSRAAQLAQRLTTVAREIAGLAREADQRLAHDAGQANTHLATLRTLNEEIARVQASGQPPNDLLDRRDAALASLNELLAVQAVPQDDGTLNLFTQAGAPLLVGSQQARLEGVPDPADPARTAVRLTVGGTSQWLDAAELGGGRLGGTLRLRDDDLAGALNQVGRLATVAGTALNAQQALGVDMDGAAGAALFRLPAPEAIPDARNTSAAALGVAVADSAALVASDYSVRWDGSHFNVTRLADGRATAFATLPATLDGLRFSVGGGAADGDEWRVRPFAAAALGLGAQPLAPRQLATGYAATVSPAATNAGGAVATQFAVVRATADNTLPVTITFNDPPTSFNVVGLATGDLANVPYVRGARVPASPADYNGWAVTLDGVPAAGDRFAVGATRAPASDNRNALALGLLAGAAMVGGATLNETYAAVLADVGSRTQSARETAEVSSRLRDESAQRQQNVAGVNLDEEAANLLRYQQAYQAAARIIQASQTLFEALLAASAR